MDRKSQIDTFGAVALILFSGLLGFNQVVIKVVNDGLQPVWFAGVRSLGATFCLALWMWMRGRPVAFPKGTRLVGFIAGLIFASEFLFLFIALDLTTVARTSVIFYSMPVWMALGAHFLLPDARLTPMKTAGLALAFLGVAWAILDRPDTGGEASIIGDLAALGSALGWAAVALMARGTNLRTLDPEMQLFYQVLVSAPVLMLAAPLFGPLIRDLEPIHLWGLAFQIVVVVTAGFSFWLWLLSIYPPASVAAFSFLGPIFGVMFGWLLLGETVGLTIWGALVLVAIGLFLINKPPRQVPQNV
jgi:drug/metabolite transporter (DMT)-like permease